MTKYNWKEIGQRVRDIRKKELQITQEELASALSTSRSVIVNVEQCKLVHPESKKPLIRFFCQKYGISEKYIFEGTGDWREYEEDTYIQNAYDLSGDAFVEGFLQTYKKKSEIEKEVLRSFIADLYNNMQKEKKD